MNIKKCKLTQLHPAMLIKQEMHLRRQGYSTPRWIEFSMTLLKEGYDVLLVAAKTTVSKYIYVRKGDKQFKVRFSNHKPNWRKEHEQDCDFFVGVTNTGVRTTKDALVAVREFFS